MDYSSKFRLALEWQDACPALDAPDVRRHDTPETTHAPSRPPRRCRLRALGLWPGRARRRRCAQAWPDKPLRIMVGASPGGGTDILARMLAEKFAPT